MKILSFVLSTAILASTAAVAAAAPNHDGDNQGDRQGDVRNQDQGQDQGQNQGQYWGNDQVDSTKDRGTVVVRNQEGDHGTVVVRNQGNDWSRGRIIDHQMPKAWESLATIRASGKQAFVSVDSQGPVDSLKLQLERGSAQIKKVIVTFENGSTFVTTLNAQLRTGEQQTIKLPGMAREIKSVQLKLGRSSRAQISLSAR